ncbi:MAG: hypothetical protein EBY73_01155, partial [Burkholderiaceae bacterium]|nr:hypothetical protein [Burkholderiaceae bacterium]
MNAINSLAIPHIATSANPQEALDIAYSFLLKPNDLSTSDLDQLFGVMHAHRLDDADLYFQHTRSEQWSLEEGIVKSGSFNIDQGVGIRAISGDKTAFAYSDVISSEALLKAAHATRVIGPKGGKVKVRAPLLASAHGIPSLYSALNPLDSLTPPKKIALLEGIERRAKARDPRIIQVMASLAGEFDVVMVARSNGLLAADIRPLVRVSIHVIAEQNGRRESGSAGGFFGNTTKTTGCVAGVTTCLANEFEVRNALAEVTTVVAGYPVVAFVDWAENTKAVKLNKALAYGVTLGKASLPGSWEVGVVTQKVEKDALFGQWIDSDYAAGNTDGDG